jgi:hypothetical protein
MLVAAFGAEYHSGERAPLEWTRLTAVQKCVIERFSGDVGAQAMQNSPRKAHCRSGLRIRMRGLAVAAQSVRQRPLRQDWQRRLQIRRAIRQCVVC